MAVFGKVRGGEGLRITSDGGGNLAIFMKYLAGGWGGGLQAYGDVWPKFKSSMYPYLQGFKWR